MTIIVSDAHISTVVGNHQRFFKMLKYFEKNRHDIVFLGDIFDLWIALPRYENGIHKEFIAWCQDQIHHRTIGYIEGNHEFFLADHKKDYFTWCTHSPTWRGKNGSLFCHGDLINRKDKNYLAFRRIVKSKLCQMIVRFLPLGPVVAEFMKQSLKETNINFRKNLPLDEIKYFAEEMFTTGVRTIFAGHFHREHQYQGIHSGMLYTVPDWFSTDMVTLFDESLEKVSFHHWMEL